MGIIKNAFRRLFKPRVIVRASRKAQRKADAASRELHRNMAREQGRKSFLGETL